MFQGLNDMIGDIAKEKNISMDMVMQTLCSSFASAAKKYLKMQKNIEVTIDRNNGAIEMALAVDIVEEIDREEEETQILLEEAERLHPVVSFKLVEKSKNSKTQELKVVPPVPGGLFFRMGLLDKDKITAINKEKVRGKNTREILQMLRDKEGEDVVITLDRDDEKGLEFTLKRKGFALNSQDPTVIEYSPELRTGQEMVVDIPLAFFGRNIITSIKQIVMQRIREAERLRIHEAYSERVGELISGTVQQIDRGGMLINLGRAEGFIPFSEQIRKEKGRFRQGDTVRSVIIDVRISSTGPQIILSRTSPDFLRELFKLEVPEIDEGIVTIKAVARDPGNRAKIAVHTKEDKIDPVGSCVGMKGNRVQNVVRELSNERIDIVNYTLEPETYIKRIFAPSEIRKVNILSEEKVIIIADEEYLAAIIGRGGQNLRLASALFGAKIDVVGTDEFNEMSEEEKEELLSVEEEYEEYEEEYEEEDAESEDADESGDEVSEEEQEEEEKKEQAETGE
ncbi:MAG: transcription termination factor NusA [Fibrobacterota bacterium]